MELICVLVCGFVSELSGVVTERDREMPDMQSLDHLPVRGSDRHKVD
jgi:hypothetical protein